MRLGLVVLAATVVLMASTLVAVILVPRAWGLQSYVVLQGSMEPTIHTGSVAIDEPVASADVGVGDIITFARPDGTYVTHRVVRLEDADGQRWLVTKGDANGVEDAGRVAAVGNGWRYRWSVPLIGYGVAEVGQPWVRLAFLLLGIAIAVRILIDAVRDVRPSAKENARSGA